MKKNQHGFSAVEALIVLVLIGLIGFIGWRVWHSKHNIKAPATASKSVPSPTPTSNWVSASNKDGNFTALFPVQPTTSPETSAVSGGISYKVNGLHSNVATSNSNSLYLVEYTTYQGGYSIPTGETDFNSSLSSIVGNLENGQLISSNYTAGAKPTESFEIRGVSGGLYEDLTGNIMVANNVLYEVIATHNTATASQSTKQAPDAQFFIDNFKLTE